jgi:alpha-ketoglutarate-dependent taurine dioxygenase
VTGQLRSDILRARRKPVGLVSHQAVTLDYLQDGRRLPLVIRPTADSVDLITWAGANRDLLQDQLVRHGGILFRGFDLSRADRFESLVATVAGELMEYRERSSPRSSVFGNVYTSTDYPSEQSIFPHNEHSYSTTFPLRIWFFCETPALRGGETPLVDMRGVGRRLDSSVWRRFVEKKWMYVRNFGNGYGLPWQTVYQTSDRRRVEEYCAKARIQAEWKQGDRLVTRQIRPAVIAHPRTGEPVWFNHITFFHISTLEPELRDGLLAGLKEDEVPNNAYYGDGSPIDPLVLDHLRDAYRDETVAFTWEASDVLMLDNVLTAHGRAPFAGPRKVLVAMSDPITRHDC